MTDKLKPCPFCGGEAYAHHDAPIIECETCKVAMEDGRGSRFDKWNTRTTSWREIDSAPKNEIDVLLFWNGEETVGYYSVDLEDPRWLHQTSEWRGQPTHWMPLPPPPEAKRP